MYRREAQNAVTGLLCARRGMNKATWLDWAVLLASFAILAAIARLAVK